MGLHRFKPPMSGRMGTLWTLSTIKNAALIEYGCMGHMLYGRVFLNRASVTDGCKLYSTHIDEADISLGDTGRLERAIGDIIKKDQPEVIFLLPSAVPTVIGTDLPAICRELQPEYPEVLLLPFGFGGFDIDGYRGVQEALLLLAKKLPYPIKKTTSPTFNIIGSCADMFRFHADAWEMERIMKGAFHMSPVCIMTSHTDVGSLRKMGSAHINLVIRREGEPTAKHLNKSFGTPYIMGRPYGIKGTLKWINEISETLGIAPDKEFIEHEKRLAELQLFPSEPTFRHIVRSHPEESVITLGGHADVVKGIMEYAVNEIYLKKGDIWCDCPSMADESIPYLTEDQWTKVIKENKKSILMASGEALLWSGRNTELQISNPDIKWRLSPYEPPFTGFRGAIHLCDIWLNDALSKED